MSEMPRTERAWLDHQRVAAAKYSRAKDIIGEVTIKRIIVAIFPVVFAALAVGGFTGSAGLGLGTFGALMLIVSLVMLIVGATELARAHRDANQPPPAQDPPETVKRQPSSVRPKTTRVELSNAKH